MKRSVVYDRDPLLVPSFGRTTEENKQDIHPEQPISEALLVPSFGRTTEENKQDIHPEQPISEASDQNQNHPITLV